MNDHGQSICLNMIVRNEAPVIGRCLDSVRALIDYWVIVDTGSDDGTQQLIRDRLAGVPGELHERPWKNFAHNRTEALEFARGKADYVFVIDADEELMIEGGFRWPELVEDVYHMEMRLGSCSYLRAQLFRNALPWCYRGVLHEHLYCPEARPPVLLPGPYTLARPEGARSRDPNKYRRDALVLEAALIDEPDNSRYVFYLAQSYRDAGEPELAIRHYRRRTTMGGWFQEVWYSLYQIALLNQKLEKPWPEVQHDFLAAYNCYPDRAEPLFQVGMYYQRLRQFRLANLFLERAAGVPRPENHQLFVEMPLYDYLIQLEYAVSCFYLDQHATAIRINSKLLRHPDLPAGLVDQVRLNRRFSVEAVQPVPPPAAPSRVGLTVCVPFVDPGGELELLVESLLRQDLSTFRIVFIDDGSRWDCRDRLPLHRPGVVLERHEVTAGRAARVQTLVETLASDDVVLVLETGQRLATTQTLSEIQRRFEDPQCQLVYGRIRDRAGHPAEAWPAASAEEFLAHADTLGQRALLAARAGLVRRIMNDGRENPHAEDSIRTALFQSATYAGTRFCDFELAIATPRLASVPRGPITKHAARREELEGVPRISCTMVTLDRLALAQRAIDSFARQSWANRELVIVTDGTPAFRSALQDYVDRQDIAGIRFVVPEEPGLPLGALRNLACDASSGSILCQWDDDDWSHPQRLELQYRQMENEGAKACLLCDHLQFFEDSGELSWLDWSLVSHGRPVHPGTLMRVRDDRVAYPESGPFARRGEDSVVLEALYAQGAVCEMNGSGYLFLYTWHGRNTFDRAHHAGLAGLSISRSQLMDRESKLRETLRLVELGRSVVVKCGDDDVFCVD